MSCCGGAEEENYGPPANQYNAAPPRGGSTYGAGGIILFQFLSYLLHCEVHKVGGVDC